VAEKRDAGGLLWLAAAQ